MTTALLWMRLLRMRRQRLIDAAGHGAASANEGFSLMEFLLAAILITIVVSGTTVTLMANNRSGRTMDNADELERLIAQDLALIRELNSRFSCCGEECAEAALPGGTSGACGSAALAAAENQHDACPDGGHGGTHDCCLPGAAHRTAGCFPHPHGPHRLRHRPQPVAVDLYGLGGRRHDDVKGGEPDSRCSYWLPLKRVAHEPSGMCTGPGLRVFTQ
ncbi:MAG: hypothetical protein DCF18_03635 [Cyanobium sp.]|nr:MAG: hypothetical protein DCF18_03635 [Cyanobium sp.]